MIALLHLSVLLVLSGTVRTDQQCSKRRSSLQVNVRSEVNGTGQRIITVDLQGAAEETGAVGVSVDHWTAMCDGAEVVAFNLTANVPSNVTVPPVVTSSLITNGTLPALSCLPGYEAAPGIGCYKEVEVPMKRNEAKYNCEADGAYLAVPESLQELDFLKQIYKRPGLALWMGIHKDSWKPWLTDAGDSSFIGWKADEPYGRGNCVVLGASGLANLHCEYLRRSICEQP